MKLIIAMSLLTLSLFAEDDRYCYERFEDGSRIMFCVSPSTGAEGSLTPKTTQASFVGFSRYFTLDTNFEVTKAEENQILQIRGVEFILRNSRYTYTVTIGKLFTTTWVAKDVLKWLLLPTMHTKISERESVSAPVFDTTHDAYCRTQCGK